MIKLQCIKCGHIQTYLKSDIVEDDTCNLCGGTMVLPKKEIVNIVKQDLITSMERQIRQFGNQKIYECIEKMGNPKMRARYRKFFIAGGGIIPDKKLKELN